MRVSFSHAEVRYWPSHSLCAGEILCPSTADEHDRVLLQVVTLTRDVGDDGPAGAELDLGDLADGRVGLLGLDRVDFAADALFLEAALEGRGLVLPRDGLAGASSDLVQCRRSRTRGRECASFGLRELKTRSGSEGRRRRRRRCDGAGEGPGDGRTSLYAQACERGCQRDHGACPSEQVRCKSRRLTLTRFISHNSPASEAP